MKYGKVLLNMIACVLGSGVIGILLLCLVYLIPVSPLYQHVKDSAYVFKIEGTWPVRRGRAANRLDNYTDALMLGNAIIHKEGASLMERALRVYFPWSAEKTPDRILVDYVEGRDELSLGTYSRYWHGYLVFLKPVLLFTDYLGIRGMNRVLQAALVFAVLAALWKYRRKRAILPFLFAIAYLRPAFLMYSMQYADIFYISLCAMLGVLFGNEKLKKGNRYLFYFLFVGVITNYIDFLTYPIASLGMPLVTWLILQEEMGWKERTGHVFLYAASWAFGYFGMWIGKWILAAGILGDFRIISDAFSQAQTRMSPVRDAVSFPRSGAVLANFQVGFEGIGMAAGAGAALVLLYILWRQRWNIPLFWFHCAPYLLICIMPLAWYLFLANHSMVHAFFTYKAMAMSVFAFLCMGAMATPASGSRAKCGIRKRPVP